MCTVQTYSIFHKGLFISTNFLVCLCQYETVFFHQIWIEHRTTRSTAPNKRNPTKLTIPPATHYRGNGWIKCSIYSPFCKQEKKWTNPLFYTLFHVSVGVSKRKRKEIYAIGSLLDQDFTTCPVLYCLNKYMLNLLH